MEFYGSQVVTPGDRYLVVMQEFMAMASVRLAELEDFFNEIEDPFDRLCSVKTQPQHSQFFDIFDHFLQSFPKPRLTMTMQKKGRGGEN